MVIYKLLPNSFLEWRP